MEKGEFKRILFEIFDELGFLEQEKQAALGSFKKKLAGSLFEAVRGALSEEEKEWVLSHADSGLFDPADSKVSEIRESIKGLYTEEALQEKSRQLFKKIVVGYVDFMSRELGLGQGKRGRLEKIAESI